MASFATASDALTAALAVVDARLTNIDVNEKLELYLELINRRAAIQQAIALQFLPLKAFRWVLQPSQTEVAR